MSMLIGMMLCFCALEPSEMLPGVWVEKGVVEIDASVAMDCHHPETPDVYLEMLITGPDSREHESLLVSSALPSNLHAGLLAAGFEPGHPVSFEDGKRVSATGDVIAIDVRVDGSEKWVGLVEWVVHVQGGTALAADVGWAGLVFAGSEILEGGEYAGDREGALVSLTPWGFEVVSPAWVLSPDASVDEPVWIADRTQVPEIGVPVRVRFRSTDPLPNADSDDNEGDD